MFVCGGGGGGAGARQGGGRGCGVWVHARVRVFVRTNVCRVLGVKAGGGARSGAAVVRHPSPPHPTPSLPQPTRPAKQTPPPAPCCSMIHEGMLYPGMSRDELDAGLDWADDHFHLLRYEQEDAMGSPTVDWVLEKARLAVLRWGGGRAGGGAAGRRWSCGALQAWALGPGVEGRREGAAQADGLSRGSWITPLVRVWPAQAQRPLPPALPARTHACLHAHAPHPAPRTPHLTASDRPAPLLLRLQARHPRPCDGPLQRAGPQPPRAHDRDRLRVQDALQGQEVCAGEG